MANSEALIAAGFGCRAGCPVEHLLAALEQALRAGGRGLEEVVALYTAQAKHAEPGLRRAAERLNKPLLGLPLERLQAQNARALTWSPQVVERFGVASIAETAALAGACSVHANPVHANPVHASKPRLLGPRIVSGNATCALALLVPEQAP